MWVNFLLEESEKKSMEGSTKRPERHIVLSTPASFSSDDEPGYSSSRKNSFSTLSMSSNESHSLPHSADSSPISYYASSFSLSSTTSPQLG